MLLWQVLIFTLRALRSNVAKEENMRSTNRPTTDRPRALSHILPGKFQMTITLQRVNRSPSCLVLGWGFRRRRIERRHFRLDQIQNGGIDYRILQFIFESKSERIIKIGLHLPKFIVKIKVVPFYGPRCILVGSSSRYRRKWSGMFWRRGTGVAFSIWSTRESEHLGNFQKIKLSTSSH